MFVEIDVCCSDLPIASAMDMKRFELPSEEHQTTHKILRVMGSYGTERVMVGGGCETM